MSYIGIPPFGQTVRSVTTATATSGQTTFNISGGYVVGYVDVYINGLLLAPTAYTATNGTTVVLGTGATVGDKFQALAYQPISLIDSLKVSNNLSDVASASTARTNLGLGSIATQDSSNVSITGGSITGITDLAVADGGTGASTLTGYVKGSGTSALTASSTIPNTDITGLGTISTQNANSVSISGGSITGITDLAVADGGTGASSLTANNVILGNGTSPVQFVAPGTNGNVLTSNGTTWTSAAAAGGAQDFELVLTATISSGTTDFDVTGVPTAEGVYMIVSRVYFDAAASNIGVWAFRFSTDNGASYYSGSSNYINGGAPGTYITAWNQGVGVSYPCGVDYYAYLIQGDGSTTPTGIIGTINRAWMYTGTLSTGAGSAQVSSGGGILQATFANINAIKFFRFTNTHLMTGGWMRIYKVTMT